MDLERRLGAFLAVQSKYYEHRPAPSPSQKSKSLFSFDGEFSVITPDFEVLKHKKEVMKDIRNICNEVNRIGNIGFQ